VATIATYLERLSNGEHMATSGNIIVKASFSKATNGAGKSAAFHARYIGTRPGTDMSRTEDDIKRDYEIEKLRPKENNQSEIYANYIGRRPGTAVSDKVDHGLFDRHGTANMTDVCSQLRGLKNTQAIKLIVSLRETDAAALSIIAKAQWEALIRKTMPQIGKALNIPPSRLGWVAAYHPKEGHPHSHIIVWDKEDQARHGYMAMTKKELTNIKRAIAREVFNEERQFLYDIKNNERTNIRSMAQEDVAAVLTGISYAEIVKPIKESDAWLRGSLMRISETLPGRGRANYQFMPYSVKKEIDVAVNRVLKTPRFSKSVDAYIKAHEAIAQNYVNDPVKIKNARENAIQELRERVNNVILKGALDYKKALAMDEIVKTKKEGLQIKLSEAKNTHVRDCMIRCLIQSGESKEEIIQEIKSTMESGVLPETMQELANDIVEKASEKEFSYQDWDTVESDMDSENIDEQEASIKTLGPESFGAISGLMHSLSAALNEAGRDKAHELDVFNSKGDKKFKGKTIIEETQSNKRQNSLFREQDLER
jgi:hypothetical protein